MLEQLIAALAMAVVAAVAGYGDLCRRWLERTSRLRAQAVRDRSTWSRIFFWLTLSSLALTIAGIVAAVEETPKWLAVTLACLAALASALLLSLRPDLRIASLDKKIVGEDEWEMFLEAAEAELADDGMDQQAAQRVVARLINERRRITRDPNAPPIPPVT